MIHDIREVVKEVLAGLLLFGGIGVLLIFLFIRGEAFWPSFLGFLLGVALAAALFLHMGMTLEMTVDTRDEKRSKYRGGLLFSIRLIGFCVVFYLAYRSGIFNMIAVLCGVLGLKVAAYMRPVVHRLFTGRKSKKEKKGG